MNVFNTVNTINRLKMPIRGIYAINICVFPLSVPESRPRLALKNNLGILLVKFGKHGSIFDKIESQLAIKAVCYK